MIEAIKAIADNAVSEAKTAIPGIFTSGYNSSDGTASIMLSIKREAVELSAQSGKHATVQEHTVQLDKVPVMFPSSGSHALTFDIKKGDRCLVVFSSTNISKWWETGEKISDNVDSRHHHLSDAIAIPGLYSRTDPIKSVGIGVAMQSKDGDAYIAIDDADRSVEFTESKKIDTGNISIKSDDIDISSGNVEVQSDGSLSTTSVGVSMESNGIELIQTLIDLSVKLTSTDPSYAVFIAKFTAMKL